MAGGWAPNGCWGARRRRRMGLLALVELEYVAMSQSGWRGSTRCALRARRSSSSLLALVNPGDVARTHPEDLYKPMTHEHQNSHCRGRTILGGAKFIAHCLNFDKYFASGKIESQFFNLHMAKCMGKLLIYIMFCPG